VELLIGILIMPGLFTQQGLVALRDEVLNELSFDRLVRGIEPSRLNGRT